MALTDPRRHQLFCHQLAAFLQTRADQADPFKLGTWLHTLSDSVLARLRKRAEGMLEQRAYPVQMKHDLRRLLLTLIKAETGVDEAGIDVPDAMASLFISLTIEQMRRRGWVEDSQVLCLSATHETPVFLTEKGLLEVPQQTDTGYLAVMLMSEPAAIMSVRH